MFKGIANLGALLQVCHCFAEAVLFAEKHERHCFCEAVAHLCVDSPPDRE